MSKLFLYGVHERTDKIDWQREYYCGVLFGGNTVQSLEKTKDVRLMVRKLNDRWNFIFLNNSCLECSRLQPTKAHLEVAELESSGTLAHRVGSFFQGSGGFHLTLGSNNLSTRFSVNQILMEFRCHRLCVVAKCSYRAASASVAMARWSCVGSDTSLLWKGGEEIKSA